MNSKNATSLYSYLIISNGTESVKNSPGRYSGVIIGEGRDA
jgi:hypothetical protein